MRYLSALSRFLQRFGAIQPPDVERGIAPRVQRLFASLSGDLGNGRLKLDEEAPILELVARYHPPAWLLISKLWTESGKDSSTAQSRTAIERYLEATPPTAKEQREAWQSLANLYRQKGDWLGFVNAVVHSAELLDVDLATISGAVNTFNSVNRELESDPDQKRAFARRLLAVMEPKIAEGDAADCSRLGWLFLQVGNRNRAWEIAQVGLTLDPDNLYCRNLERRLSTDIAQGLGQGF